MSLVPWGNKTHPPILWCLGCPCSDLSLQGGQSHNQPDPNLWYPHGWRTHLHLVERKRAKNQGPSPRGWDKEWGRMAYLQSHPASLGPCTAGPLYSPLPIRLSWSSQCWIWSQGIWKLLDWDANCAGCRGLKEQVHTILYTKDFRGHPRISLVWWTGGIHNPHGYWILWAHLPMFVPLEIARATFGY